MTPGNVRTNPYPGLAPFEERDAPRFFGRDREIDEILERLAARRLLAVVGVSGCGKTSLVRAGVVPVLRMGASAQFAAVWRIYTIMPGSAPLAGLASALGAPPNWPSSSYGLTDHLRRTLQPGENALIVVDQFEEIFRFRAEAFAKDGGNESSLFVNLLLNAVDQRDVPIYVVLTMRTDYLGECAGFRGLPEALNDHYYMVPRMTRLQQQSAIEGPLQQGEQINGALIQQLLNDSAEDPDHLPVLQHLLKRIWEVWDAQSELEPMGMSHYRAVGGWKEAVSNDAEAVVLLFPDNEEAIDLLFRWITARGMGVMPVRRPRPFSECLRISGLDRDSLCEIIRSFQRRGLLRASQLTEESLIDLPHESVIWQWPRLMHAIARESEQAFQLRFLLQSARMQMPLTGLALLSAIDLRAGWRRQRMPALRYLTPQELEEVEFWIGQSAGLDAANRNSAEARELSAWAAVSLADDPERSLILGLYAWDRQREMAAGLEQSLHDALLQSQVRLTLRGHAGSVNGIAWSPDGLSLATASDDGTARIWDAETGSELATLIGHGKGLWDVSWAPDGHNLATASDDGTVAIWDLRTVSQLLRIVGHEREVSGVAWSPDGARLATASGDGTAKVWNAATGLELATLRGHEGPVSRVSWSPDGTKIATGSDDQTARIWEASAGRELAVIRDHTSRVASVAWSPDGERLATASWDQTAGIWAVADNRALQRFSGHKSLVLAVAWSPDGSRLATGGYDNALKVWDATEGQLLLTARAFRNCVRCLSWSPDGHKVAVGSQDYSAKVWLTAPGCELLTLRGHGDSVRCVVWSPDGGRLATASHDGTAMIWEANTGLRQSVLRGHDAQVVDIAWTPDGSRVATAGFDHSARVWDQATGAELLGPLAHTAIVRGVAWSPDGTMLATAGDDQTAKIWDAMTGEEIVTLHGHMAALEGIAWSPDGTMLATAGSDRTVRLWDAQMWTQLASLTGAHSFSKVAWSPDGAHLLTACLANTASIWEVATGGESLILDSHQDWVSSAAWSPDASRVATASWDGTVKLWDATTGRELLTLHGHQDSALSVSWSPDGHRLASAGRDAIAQTYALDETQLLRLVRSRVTRPLSPDECRRYLNTDKCPPLPEVP